VARTYHVSESELADANDLSEGDGLAAVDALVVPVAPSAEPAGHTVMYTARRGDTLVSIADRFGLSLDQLRRWNHLAAGEKHVAAGSRLHVAEPAAPRRRGKHSRTTITAEDLHPHTSAKKGATHARKKKAHSSSAATASAKQK
jgi:membrane-bound lytic murein transglycosylase D